MTKVISKITITNLHVKLIISLVSLLRMMKPGFKKQQQELSR